MSRPVRIGFYLEGTHDMCEPGPTRPAAAGRPPRVVAALAEALSAAAGVVQAIDVAENREASERALHLELAAEADPSRLAAAAAIDGVTGLSLSHVGSRRVRVLHGDGARDRSRSAAGDRQWSLTRIDAHVLPGQPLPARACWSTTWWPRSARRR